MELFRQLENRQTNKQTDKQTDRLTELVLKSLLRLMKVIQEKLLVPTLSNIISRVCQLSTLWSLNVLAKGQNETSS